MQIEMRLHAAWIVANRRQDSLAKPTDPQSTHTAMEVSFGRRVS